MKKSKIIFTALCSGLLFGACNDLDKEPMSNVVTQIMKEQIVDNDPDMVSASVNAIPEMVNAFMNTFGTHQDYGWSSMMLMMDSRGTDMPSNLGGYQWYTAALEYSDFGGLYYDNLYYWYTNYNMIRTANAVAAVIPADTEEASSKYNRAQALAYRAWGYFNLAQMYAWTYAKEPQGQCVPLVLDTNMNEAASVGCARATTEEVYNQVLTDLTDAINLLKQAEEAGINRKTQAATATLEKTYFNLTAAYGLRARVNLFKCDYAACVSDCQECLRLCTAEGLRPYNRDEFASPRFVNITDPSWILGIYNDPSSTYSKSIANFDSFMSAWTDFSYASKGMFRKINAKLYSEIPGNDVRKGWWLNEAGATPAALSSAYADLISAAKIAWEPYTQIKFGANEEDLNVHATDVPLMRVEEIYLMLAEAQGYTSPADGLATLTNFVSTYRQPGYAEKASSFEELREEVWFQRRIELWGEGFSFWDIMRLQKPVNRIGGGFDPTNCFNIAPTNTCLLFDIPQQEAQRNKLITNPSHFSTVPTPVEDK